MTSGPHSYINHNEKFEDAIMSSRCSSSSSFADAKSTDSGGATQEIVAASTAIMGENVVDSPTTHKLLLLKHRSALVANTPTTPSMDDSSGNKNDQPHPSGIVSQGLDWARKQRDKRQRDYLQQQAESQLRKLREAQANPEQAMPPTPNSSIFDNSTFRNLFSLPNTDHPKKNDEPNDPHPETDDHISKGISKSGGGYSVQLPIQPKEEEKDASFIPPVRIQPEEDNSNPFLLTPAQRQQIAETVLPRGISYAKWQRLYSLARDGDSFACCLRHVGVHKPTLLVVTTTRGACFGGLADAPWNQHSIVPQYYGGSTACLFRVHADGHVQAYPWTGANRYIQLCDTQHSMLAFGGGDGGFGLAVSQDFTVGSTGRSATFGNDPLCEQDTFEVLDVEIYGFLTGQF